MGGVTVCVSALSEGVPLLGYNYIYILGYYALNDWACPVQRVAQGHSAHCGDRTCALGVTEQSLTDDEGRAATGEVLAISGFNATLRTEADIGPSHLISSRSQKQNVAAN